MMMTILAFAIAATSLLFMVGGLRMVAQDTIQTVASIALRARNSGQLPARMAFAALWVMIFALSYM